MAEKTIRIVPDSCVEGFIRRFEKRLSYIGVEIIWPPRGYYYDDHLLYKFAEKNNAIVVTADKEFPQRGKILIPYEKLEHYEEAYTFLVKKIGERRRGDVYSAGPSRA